MSLAELEALGVNHGTHGGITDGAMTEESFLLHGVCISVGKYAMSQCAEATLSRGSGDAVPFRMPHAPRRERTGRLRGCSWELKLKPEQIRQELKARCEPGRQS